MTSDERLAEFESWLLAEYNATYELWVSTGGPFRNSQWFKKMQVLQQVARHLIAGRDDLVPLYEERLIVFARHVDFTKRR